MTCEITALRKHFMESMMRPAIGEMKSQSKISSQRGRHRMHFSLGANLKRGIASANTASYAISCNPTFRGIE